LFVGWFSNRNSKYKNNPLTKIDWAKIFFLGIAGYYLASLFDFLGLQYLTAGLERLILFTYPTFVVLLSLINGQKISKTIFIALPITYLGIAIAFWGSISFDNNTNLFLGASFIFLAAFLFALYIFGSGTMLKRVGTLRFTSIAMSAAAIAIITHHAVVHQLQLFHFQKEVYYLSLLMAIIATALPSFLVAEGIRIIGANRAAVIGSIGPISTIVLAYFFLGESFGSLEILGTILVISGVLLISLRKK
ncbi:MAG TPA: DMT family transporter, partial [Bacteroidetes bacterium]|nr:DMT family transporter [Bacteroidota bacterium]